MEPVFIGGGANQEQKILRKQIKFIDAENVTNPALPYQRRRINER